ncbi:hypothetical protein IMCC3317_46030 [Kordia antarctica]|uniref:Uncharacterized protein n=1 Tax=Kordia antarctica TaxID=1218801 RepID=A0A7L4ZR72_9FLAO|nr:hypothetical protein [Kordia antarctica]QHI39198.1 hypothetical protein IMCC3317_46030 [Kordia antarctica]
MLKNILKLEGVQLLSKKEQIALKGGHDCQCDGPDNEYLWETPCNDTLIGC